jgi:hypothetical protein
MLNEILPTSDLTIIMLAKSINPVSSEGQSFLDRRKRSVPARSKKQQMAPGAALAGNPEKWRKSSLKSVSKQMEKSMPEKQLEDVGKS